MKRKPAASAETARKTSRTSAALPDSSSFVRPDSYPTVTPQVEEVLSAIGEQRLSAKEIMDIMGLEDKSNFPERRLHPVSRPNLAKPIYPENPKHPRQKHRLTGKGTTEKITGGSPHSGRRTYLTAREVFRAEFARSSPTRVGEIVRPPPAVPECPYRTCGDHPGTGRRTGKLRRQVKAGTQVPEKELPKGTATQRATSRSPRRFT